MIIAVALVAVWFAFLRPPPSFVGTWTATALDIHQYTIEDAFISPEVPASLLAATLQGQDAKGTLQIDASGQFTLGITGTNQGTLSSSPAVYMVSGTTLTFVSDNTHVPFTCGLGLFVITQGGGGVGFDRGNDPPPNGQTGFQMVFMPSAGATGQVSGDFTRTPKYQSARDPNGNFRTLDLIAGKWIPQQFNYMQTGGGSNVSASLTITSDGHYSFVFSLQEHGIWKSSGGNWSRQIASGNYSPPSPDTGTYTFTGRNAVSLYDQNGMSRWKRTS